MCRRRAATAADNVQKAALSPLAQLRRKALRSFRKSRRQQRIWQACIRIRASVNRRKLRQLLNQRPHLLRTERAIHSDAQQRHIRNRIPKRLDRLPRHAAIASRLNKRHRRHNRYSPFFSLSPLGGEGMIRRDRVNPIFRKIFLNRPKRRFRIQRVEDRLDQQNIHAPVQQAAHLLDVCSHQFIKTRPSRPRIIYVRRNR